MTNPAPQDRSPAEVARERALGEISDVLLNLEHTLARAEKALQRIRKSGGDHNIELAYRDDNIFGLSIFLSSHNEHPLSPLPLVRWIYCVRSSTRI